MGEGGALQLARLSLGCSCFVLFVVLVGTSTSTATAEQTFARANNSLFAPLLLRSCCFASCPFPAFFCSVALTGSFPACTRHHRYSARKNERPFIFEKEARIFSIFRHG